MLPACLNGVPLLAALRAAVFIFLALPISAVAGEFRNLSIEQALEKLRANGVTILYSSDLIKPWMRVRGDPSADNPQQILLEILEPYGLTARESLTGQMLLVRRSDPEPLYGAVSGIVVRKSDGSPLPGASVRLDAIEEQFKTALDGTFNISSGLFRIL